MNSKLVATAIGLTLSLSLAACGGGGSSASTTPPTAIPTSAPVALTISDATTEDWATIGVRILSIALTPQDGGSPVTVYKATGTAPMINLVQLDQLGEILGNASVPVGTYTSATVTLAANPGDVLLTASASPTAGFAAAPGSTIPASEIQIQHASGSSGALTVPVTVNLVTPLVVSSSTSNALDLEFDLGHPAFIVGHVPVGGGSTAWAVSFDGPLRHHPIANLADRILRHAYGTVTAVSSDNTSLTLTKDLPTMPIVTPETATATSQSIAVLADVTNGTLYYDVDARTPAAVVKDFSTVATGLSGKYVRVAARYQQDGTLVATRIWASSTFNSVWVSPEGHVLGVDTTANTLTVSNELGGKVTLLVDANTQFVTRLGKNNSDTTPIGSGPSFLGNLVTGFKVHASVVDPLAASLTAQTVEIETATFAGLVSAADSSGVTYARTFRDAARNYVKTLPYISATTTNGVDSAGNAIEGFKWWNFGYPTLVTSGPSAVTEFVTLSTGAVNFGGTLGTIRTHAVTNATWNDTAAPNAWSAPWAIVEPTPLPIATVTTGLDAGNAFTMTAINGSHSVTVDVSTAQGSATLAYQIDRNNDVVTVNPLDLTTSSALATFTTDLAAGATVKVGGVPQPDGSIKAYSVAVYTGTKSGS